MVKDGMLKLDGVIQLRGGTCEAMRGANPLLLRREIAVEVDTCRLKVGDGVKRWNELPYANVGAVEVSHTVTLTGEHVSQKCIGLPHECEPSRPVKVYIQGLLAERGTDYDVSNDKVIAWDGYGLESIVQAGDRVYVSYYEKG